MWVHGASSPDLCRRRAWKGATRADRTRAHGACADDRRTAVFNSEVRASRPGSAPVATSRSLPPAESGLRPHACSAPGDERPSLARAVVDAAFERPKLDSLQDSASLSVLIIAQSPEEALSTFHHGRRQRGCDRATSTFRFFFSALADPFSSPFSSGCCFGRAAWGLFHCATRPQVFRPASAPAPSPPSTIGISSRYGLASLASFAQSVSRRKRPRPLRAGAVPPNDACERSTPRRPQGVQQRAAFSGGGRGEGEGG